jgi:hypothetical protein
MTVPREQLTRHPPAGYIGRFDDGLVMFGQVPEHSLELLILKETFAGVIQSQSR